MPAHVRKNHIALRRAKHRRDVVALYGLITELGENLYEQAIALFDSDEEVACAWATAILVHSLEERNQLKRIEAVM